MKGSRVSFDYWYSARRKGGVRYPQKGDGHDIGRMLTYQHTVMGAPQTTREGHRVVKIPQSTVVSANTPSTLQKAAMLLGGSNRDVAVALDDFISRLWELSALDCASLASGQAPAA